MKLLTVLLLISTFTFGSSLDIKVDSSTATFDQCNIPMARDSGLVYIGGVLNSRSYYYPEDVMIPKVVYSSNGIEFMYKFTLPLNMPVNETVLSVLGFNYFLKWTGDSRNMIMQTTGSNIVFIDTDFVTKHCK
jgi:hypothetical protein